MVDKYSGFNILNSVKPLIVLCKLFGISTLPLNRKFYDTVELDSYAKKKLYRGWFWGIIVFIFGYYLNFTYFKTVIGNTSIFLYASTYVLCVYSESDLFNLICRMYEIDRQLNGECMTVNRPTGYSYSFALLMYCIATAMTLVSSFFSGIKYDKEFVKLFTFILAVEVVFSANIVLFISIIDELAHRHACVSSLWSEALLDRNCTPERLERIRTTHGKLRRTGNNLNSAFSLRLVPFFVMSLLKIFFFMYNYYFQGFTPTVVHALVLVIGMIIVVHFTIHSINKLLIQSTSIADNLLITPFSKLSPRCQIQIRMMFYNLRNSPLSLNVCGHAIDSHIWPAVIMEETTYWLAAVQVRQEIQRLSSNLKLRF